MLKYFLSILSLMLRQLSKTKSQGDYNYSVDMIHAHKDVING